MEPCGTALPLQTLAVMRLLRLNALALVALPALAMGQSVQGVPPLARPSPAPVGVTAEPMIVPRLNGAIILDGRVDEPAWEDVTPLPLVTHWPEFGGVPSEPTEIRLAYDIDYVYLSCRCYAPPEAVFAASFRRDLWTLGTDYLALVLDTFNDNENAVYFLTSPTGSRTDVAISDDAASDPDPNWDTFWDAEATISDAGWFAEMRIPFSSLRYQTENGRVVMGLSTFRYLGRKNEMDLFPAIPPDWGFYSNVKPSQLQKVVFEGILPRRPIYVTPYALGGLGQSFDLNDAETAYVRADDPVTELGGDLKMSLTDNLTLDLTLNTDFAQVEADNAQVNLTRFSLFFPEKRRFFLERASIFDFDLGGSNRVFYSRRIGLYDGQAVRLLGGGRLVGRLGAWDVGVLEMQTARFTEELAPEDALPSENFGVVRLRRQVFNPHSTVGGIVTSRLGEGGAYNVVYGFDGDVRLFGDSYVALTWAQAFDDETEGGPTLVDRARVRAIFERRAYTGFSYEVGAERAGVAWRPDLGFELRDDFWAIILGGRQGWGPSPGSPFARHRLGVSTQAYLRNFDGTTETVELEATWDGQLSSGAFFDVALTVTYDDLREGFVLSDDAEVLPGSYTFAASRASIETPRGRALSGWLGAGGGVFYDGWRVTAEVSPKWVASRFLEVSGGYEVNRIGFPNRDQTFTAHIGRVRIKAALDTKWSLSSLLQLSSAADVGTANVRLRYNPREGVDLYLVFNEGFNTNRPASSPALPFASRRAILAKYTYTFAL